MAMAASDGHVERERNSGSGQADSEEGEGERRAVGKLVKDEGARTGGRTGVRAEAERDKDHHKHTQKWPHAPPWRYTGGEKS